MSFDDEVRKFQGCAEFAGLHRSKADRIVAAVQNLETVTDMRSVFAGMFA